MTAAAFQKYWAGEEGHLRPISRSVLNGLGLQPATADFLAAAGLPEYAEPGLSFVAEGESHDTIGRMCAHVDISYPDDTAEACIVIGAAHDGNDMVAVDTSKNDRIFLLHIWDSSIVEFVNSSIGCLADFIVLYRDFERDVMAGKDPDDLMAMYDFTDPQYERLRSDMQSRDPDALQATGFWAAALRTLLELREEHRQEPTS